VLSQVFARLARISARTTWIFIRPESLTGKRFFVLISHELGHATLGHRPTELRSWA